MKGSKIFVALVSASCLSLYGSESKDDYVFQVNRCEAAYAMDDDSNAETLIKSAGVVAQYMNEHNLEDTPAEETANTEKIMSEIFGVPNSTVEVWKGRARKITESDFCKNT